MKNFEKYEKEIRKHGIDDIGIIKGKIIRCTDSVTRCTKCEFYDELVGCYEKMTEWLYTEYTEPKPTITSKEKAFLEAIDEDSAYIARGRDGMLIAYEEKPVKTTDYWLILQFCDYRHLVLKPYLFPFIKWEDDEPWSVEELLKLEVKDE